MKRQATGQQTKVYAYGCAVPTAGWTSALAEQARCWDMWDALVRMDAALEAETLTLADADCEELREARKALASVQTNLESRLAERRAVQQTARRREPTPDLDAQIAALAAERGAVQRTVWAALKAWRTSHQETVQRLRDERRDSVRRIRQQSGCFWGNSNRVLDTYETARSRGMKTGCRPQTIDPRRRDGVLTVQIQRTRTGLGAAPDELDGTALSAVALAPTPHGPGTHVLRMRVDRAAAVLVCPVWLHRPLPSEGRIKSVQWTWRRGEAQWRYQVAFTVTFPASASPVHTSTLAAGLDLGYRLQDDGALLVGTAVDSAGMIERFHLSPVLMAKLDHADRLRGEANDFHDDQRAREGANLRAKMLRRRREQYRLWARDICRRYAVLVLEDWDLRGIARVKRQETDAQPQAEAPVRAQRCRAALSEFREALMQRAAKTGTRVIEEPAAYTTLTCHACGHVQARQVVDRLAVAWTCDSCGRVWDQDVNAAKNLLAALTRERSSGEREDTEQIREDAPRQRLSPRDRSRKGKKSSKNRRDRR